MNEETYEDINIKPISLDNEGHLNVEQVEKGGTPIRLHSTGGGGSKVTPVIIDISDYMGQLFDNFYDNDTEFYEVNITQELQEQFDKAVTALNEDITTPVYFFDSAASEYFSITTMQLADPPQLATWYHWSEPSINGEPPHIVMVSIGIQSGMFFGAIKRIDLNGPIPDEGEPKS